MALAEAAVDSDWHTISFNIPFATPSAASTALRVLTVDRTLRSSELTRTISISQKSPSQMTVEFKALTLKQARVSVDHFLEDVKLVVETMNEFGTPEFGAKEKEGWEEDDTVEVGLRGTFDGTNIR